jgi:BirA family biotin operon repressor/biotin-[acetyl-CoA-carboxylase] ligase
MDEGRVLAAKGASHGTVIAAAFQSAGRGRAGRSWNITRGEGLPFTIILRYSSVHALPSCLTLKAGLAASLAIERAVADSPVSPAPRVLVKWPNDIMVVMKNGTGGKIAGILAEASGAVVCLGMGINIAQTAFPPDLSGKASSLALAFRRTPDAFALLESILAGLYAVLETESPWRQPLEDRLYMKGRVVRFIDGAAGSGRVVEGRLRGIGPEGELLIRPEGENEDRRFITGELDVYG